MATQYNLTGSFTAITEESGTIQNIGYEAAELVSTSNAVEGEGIELLPGEKRTFNGAMKARSKGGTNTTVNVVDFKDAAGGGGSSYTLPVATGSTLGGVKSSSASGDVTVNSDGTMTVNGGSAYTLPTASASTLGGIKVGDRLSIDANGVLSAADQSYNLPTAGASTLGGIKVGDRLSIDGDGVLSAADQSYTLPTASASTTGGIKVGSGLSIDADGVLSSSGSAYSLPVATASTLGGVKSSSVTGDISVNGTTGVMTYNAPANISINEWQANTNYKSDEIVSYKGGLNKCLADHTSGDSFLFVDGYNGNGQIWYRRDRDVSYDTTVSEYSFDLSEIKDITNLHFELYSKSARWKTLTFTVSDDDLTYTALTTWTSSDNWVESEAYDIPVTGSGRYVKVVASNMQEWDRPKEFKMTNLTITVEDNKWKSLSGYPEWSSNTDYKAGTLVTNKSKIYKCITAHTSTSTFDATKWTEISASGGVDLPEWQPNTSYTTGKYLVHEGTVYKVDNDFTSGTTFSDTNLTAYIAPIMEGATSSTDGKAGMVIKPTTTDVDKFLKGDGTWGSAGGGVQAARVTLWEGLYNTVNNSSTLIQTQEILSIEGYDQFEVTYNGNDTGSDGNIISLTYNTSDIVYGIANFRLSVVANSSYYSCPNFGFADSTHFGIKAIDRSGWPDTHGITKIVGIKYIQPDSYSTEEKLIGTWIDGKPLYRKVFADVVDNTNSGITLSTTTVVKLYGCIVGGDGTFTMSPNADTELYIVRSSGVIRTTTARILDYVVVEYTKN